MRQLQRVEEALGLAQVMPGRAEYSKAQITQMLESALERSPALRAQCTATVDQLRTLMSKLADKLGSDAPDLLPLFGIVKGLAGLLPSETEAEAGDDGGADVTGEGAGVATRGSGRALSGSVTTREEAMRAIDLVIAFLEKSEPTNPAPLFLRRARQLVSHNFLQLVKALAPEALAEVARVVGVDPDSVTDPETGS